jgi:hypothetical protein
MPQYACRVCGAPSDQRRCPQHRRQGDTSWSGNRDRQAQARFRAAVLARDEYRCTFQYDGAERCAETKDLRAAHWPRPLSDFVDGDPEAYNPQQGRTLCPTHDRLLDAKAR